MWFFDKVSGYIGQVEDLALAYRVSSKTTTDHSYWFREKSLFVFPFPVRPAAIKTNENEFKTNSDIGGDLLGFHKPAL